MRIIGKASIVTMLATTGIAVLPGLAFLVLKRGTTEPGGEALPFVAAVLLVSSPTILPLSLFAGALAGFVLQRQQTSASLWVWIIRAVSVGSVLGALGAPAAPLLFYGAPWPHPVLAMFAISGGGAGTLTGLFVAVWCYRAQQGTRPVNKRTAPLLS